ncbi:pentapeptide repeat-containing protein [Terasakiella sp. A23]|uniref:pentapeptide repeat-containing protein n=1 Tax=Terasakiella sp. FCG-A23 TaxID=3080561 RepID=UPI0029559F9B|nr:pentapeptide repeat-containing protein [Terasakiella sp. A23]MDV7341753.1 pentapeptide repeat-containing protein [Terasakiella sp. A23]
MKTSIINHCYRYIKELRGSFPKKFKEHFYVLETIAIILTIISICISGYIYISETPDRAEEREVRKMALRQNAFQVLDRARGNDNDIGQRSAAEALHNLEVSLEGLDMPKTSFRGVKLPGVNLSFAKLSESNFSGADLSNSFFHRADLEGAFVTRANFTRAMLAEINFCKADIASSSFIGAKLLGSDLRKANLSKADFTNANVGGVDFTGATLNQANLSKAINLTQEQIDSACVYKDRQVYTDHEDGTFHGTADTTPPSLPPGFSPPQICVPIYRPLESQERQLPNIDCSSPSFFQKHYSPESH